MKSRSKEDIMQDLETFQYVDRNRAQRINVAALRELLTDPVYSNVAKDLDAYVGQVGAFRYLTNSLAEVQDLAVAHGHTAIAKAAGVLLRENDADEEVVAMLPALTWGLAPLGFQFVDGPRSGWALSNNSEHLLVLRPAAEPYHMVLEILERDNRTPIRTSAPLKTQADLRATLKDFLPAIR